MPTSPSPSRTTFHTHLALYPSLHHHRHRNKPAPNNICDCEYRFTTAPSLVASRRQQSNSSSSPNAHPSGYLTVDELARLVEWKIHHGSFFPALPKLARANDAALVRRVTGEAFALLSSSTTTTSPSTAAAAAAANPAPPAPATATATVMAALHTLTQLKGVGPATASLLLSIADDGTSIPFFADEAFLWMRAGFEGDAVLPSKKGVRIRYDVKEYEELLVETRAFLGRMMEGEEGKAVKAKDVEMVARVLAIVGGEGEKGKGKGKGEGRGIGDGDAGTQNETNKPPKKDVDDEQPPKQPARQKKRKRPATESKTEKSAVDTKDSAAGRRVMPRRAAKQS